MLKTELQHLHLNFDNTLYEAVCITVYNME